MSRMEYSVLKEKMKDKKCGRSYPRAARPIPDVAASHLASSSSSSQSPHLSFPRRLHLLLPPPPRPRLSLLPPTAATPASYPSRPPPPSLFPIHPRSDPTSSPTRDPFDVPCHATNAIRQCRRRQRHSLSTPPTVTPARERRRPLPPPVYAVGHRPSPCERILPPLRRHPPFSRAPVDTAVVVACGSRRLLHHIGTASLVHAFRSPVGAFNWYW
jgi:hypothetical protein